MREAVTEVRGRTTITIIVGRKGSRTLTHGTVRAVGLEEIPKRHRRTRSPKNRADSYAELKVFGGLKADFFKMHKWLVLDIWSEQFFLREDPLGACHATDGEFASYGAKDAGYTRNIDRSPIEPHHCRRFSVVAEQKRAPIAGAEPKALLSSRKLETSPCESDRRVQ